MAQQLASGRCVPRLICVSIILRICQSTTATSAATSATRTTTSSPSPCVTRTASPCIQERTRGMFSLCTYSGRYRKSHTWQIQPYDVNGSYSASHWTYVDHARAPNVQRQQHHPPVNTSSFINSYPPRETNLGSRSTGGTGGAAIVSYYKLELSIVGDVLS